MAERGDFTATGRRKRSIARVRMRNGKGTITVNGKDIRDYFPLETLVMDIMQPLTLTKNEKNFDIAAKIIGGGFTGQAGALRLGIARALLEVNPEYRTPLKAAGLITRDPRKKERKKYGLKKARRAPQFSKR
jgi:small subunit ribosomal protein S9